MMDVSQTKSEANISREFEWLTSNMDHFILASSGLSTDDLLDHSAKIAKMEYFEHEQMNELPNHNHPICLNSANTPNHIDVQTWNQMYTRSDASGPLDTLLFNESVFEDMDASLFNILNELSWESSALVNHHNNYTPTLQSQYNAYSNNILNYNAPSLNAYNDPIYTHDTCILSDISSYGANCSSPQSSILNASSSPSITSMAIQKEWSASSPAMSAESMDSTINWSNLSGSSMSSPTETANSTQNLKGECSSDELSSKPSSGNIGKVTEIKRSCLNCHTKETIMWRRHPKGGYLCNPCGAYYRAHGDHRPIKAPEDPSFDGMRCNNCSTGSTIMWRQTPGQGRLCNACGLFWRKHKKNRPLKLCKNMICKRKRHRREINIPPSTGHLSSLQMQMRYYNDLKNTL